MLAKASYLLSSSFKLVAVHNEHLFELLYGSRWRQGFLRLAGIFPLGVRQLCKMHSYSGAQNRHDT
jgi:hypothetical protein